MSGQPIDDDTTTPPPDTTTPPGEALLTRLLRPLDRTGVWGWIGTAAVTLLAAILRLVHLDRPARLLFDETYYVKQAYSMLMLGYEGRWEKDVDDAFALGDYSGLSADPDYVVHPPGGKWLIAAGMKALGTDSVVGWRISGAVAGIVAVFLLTRIARRLLGSNLLAVTAGALLAVDGMHIVLSRTGILDIFLSTFVLAAFGALLLDRDWYRRRLAERVGAELAQYGRIRDPWGPRVGVRWWLLVTGVLSGAACSVKWSGIYAVAVFGVLAVVWSTTARRAVGVRMWVGGGLVRDGVAAFVQLVPVALGTYLLGWVSWFCSDNGYNRHWARDVNALAEVPQRTWMPDSLNSLLEYHLQMWGFHNGLDSPHTYSSHPIGWLLQLRPTSIAWRKLEAGDPGVVGDGDWVEAVLAVGNPIVWWAGALALLVVIWWALRRRDWRAWAILGGYAATYVPWFANSTPFANRTIFTFYTVAIAPFVVLALTFALGVVLGSPTASPSRRRGGAMVFVVVVVAAFVVAAFFWPLWSGAPMPRWYWNLHMWIGNVEHLRIGWV